MRKLGRVRRDTPRGRTDAADTFLDGAFGHLLDDEPGLKRCGKAAASVRARARWTSSLDPRISRRSACGGPLPGKSSWYQTACCQRRRKLARGAGPDSPGGWCRVVSLRRREVDTGGFPSISSICPTGTAPRRPGRIALGNGYSAGKLHRSFLAAIWCVSWRTRSEISSSPAAGPDHQASPPGYLGNQRLRHPG